MKATINPLYIKIALHVVIWGILLLLPYFISTAANDYRLGSIPGLFFTTASLAHIAVFYINAFYLYPKFYNKRFWWLYMLTAAMLIFASFQFKQFIMTNWFADLEGDALIYRFIFAPSIVVFIISLIYRKIIDGIQYERIQKEKQAEQIAMELKFLRSQISPHFLFNVLTNLVSLARKKSDKLEQALITLADLMRYILYDSQGKKITLKKEIEYLDNYIQLQKLRFGNDVQINCNTALDDEKNYSIEPMLLIPFVENAFKHGVGYIDQPQIDIELSVVNGTLIFEVRNKFEDEAIAGKDENPGIGLDNIKSRLNLLYKDSYTLMISDQNNLFRATLILKLV